MAVIETEFVLPSTFGMTSVWATATRITRLPGGREQRIGKWANLLKEIVLTYDNRLGGELRQLVDLFGATEGELDGFLIEDKVDFDTSKTFGAPVVDDDVSLGTGDGSTTTFQLRKRYTFGAKTAYRKITRPRVASVLCAVGGVGTTAFSVDAVTGVVTFDSAPANLATVTAGFSFVIPVRVDTEKLSTTVVDKSVLDGFVTASTLPLVELRMPEQ